MGIGDIVFMASLLCLAMGLGLSDRLLGKTRALLLCGFTFATVLGYALLLQLDISLTSSQFVGAFACFCLVLFLTLPRGMDGSIGIIRGLLALIILTCSVSSFALMHTT